MSETENLFNEDILRPNVNAAAYFILLYERFEDTVISTVKERYSNFCMLDGKPYSNIDDGYIKALKEKISTHDTDFVAPYERLLRNAIKGKETYVNEVIDPVRGKKNDDGKRFRGSLNWLKENGVFSDDEIEQILKIRTRRNDVVHELLRVLSEGLAEDDAKMIADLLEFNLRVNNWRFQQIEMPVMGIELPESTSPEDVLGGDDVALMGIFRILFCNEGKEFKDVLEKATGKI